MIVTTPINDSLFPFTMNCYDVLSGLLAEFLNKEAKFTKNVFSVFLLFPF